MEYKAEVQGREIHLEKTEKGIQLIGELASFAIEKIGEEYFVYQEKNISKIKILKREGTELTLHINGKEAKVKVKDRIAITLEKLGMDSSAEVAINEVKAPMPGVILDVLAKENQDVEKGDPLLILEAMKMENMIKSPTSGKIKLISVSKGQSVEKNALLVQFH